jgi:type II secretory pathway component PulF
MDDQMSMQPPAIPGTERSIWRIDLLDLPVLRQIVEPWRMLIFANGAVRRDAKALLFAELAEAARRGMPMAVALDLAGETQADTRRRSGTRKPIARGFWESLGDGLWTLAILWTQMFYVIFAWRFADPARVARLLAWRLRGHSMKGFLLSDAMRACAPADFDPAEIAIVAQGEKTGTLPQALRHLADFMVTENRIAVMGTHALTPLFYIVLVAVPVIIFWRLTIWPKYQELFNQLGVEMPHLTSGFMGYGGALWELVAALLAFACIFYLVRMLMNGNAGSKDAAMVGLAVAWMFAAFAAIGLALQALPVGMTYVAVLLVVVFLAGLIAGLAILPSLLGVIETVVLGVERLAAPMLLWLPFVGAAQRAQAEARWMAALGVGLDAGLPAHEALEGAGTMSGGALGNRTTDAAELARKGLSIGAACEKCRVLRPQVNHQLALVDWRGDHRDGLRAIADDTSFRAIETLRRSARFADVFMMTAFAIFTFFVVMAMYLPLFGIPRIVGR